MKVVSNGSNNVVEWLAIYLEKKNIVLGCLYRPPSCQWGKFKEALDDIDANINKLGCPSPTILICGDFNLPIVKWEDP